jgi:signal transduction histidine kinase
MEEELEQIFKLYYRGQKLKDPKREIVGAGIGLFVVKKIIIGHGGTISVSSRKFSAEGEGYKTVFKIILPLRLNR